MKKQKSSKRFKLRVVRKAIEDRVCSCDYPGGCCICGAGGSDAYYRIWDTKLKKFTRHHSSDLIHCLLTKDDGIEKVRLLNTRRMR